jgi:hypothetical protein
MLNNGYKIHFFNFVKASSNLFLSLVFSAINTNDYAAK